MKEYLPIFKDYLPLISGFVGALIGAFAAVITIWIQTRAQNNREKLKLVSQLAMEDYKFRIEQADKSGTKYKLYPVVTYLHYHFELFKLLDKGKLTPEKYAEISKKNDDLIEALHELQRGRFSGSRNE